MAENVLNVLDTTPTPSQFLNLLVTGVPVVIGENTVQYLKNEYSVRNQTGEKIFNRLPNAMSFWELTQFLGIESEDIK
jgi:hypothetical protein